MTDNKKAETPLHGAPAVIAEQSREHKQYTPDPAPRQEAEDEPAYFAMITADVLYDKELRPNAKLMFAVLSSLTKKCGYCWASNKRIGEWFNLAPSTVGALITQLSQRGLIFVVLMRDEKNVITGRRIYVEQPPEDAGVSSKSRTPLLEIEDRGILEIEEKINIDESDNKTPYNPPKGDVAWKPERFEKFWAYYPAMGGRSGGRKPAKARARRAWDKLRPDDDTIRAMATALIRQKASQQWQDGVGIPYASTWLNQRMWEEEYEAPQTRQQTEEAPEWI